jgi:hypothetical protein
MPAQLANAHAKAHAAHLAVGLKKRSPYGVALAGLVREYLAQTVRELGASNAPASLGLGISPGPSMGRAR